LRIEEVAWLPASEILARTGAGHLDPQAVVRAHLEAIDRFDARIHAYIHVDRNAHSTNGVTLAVKDNLPVAGMPWTDGSAAWRERVADRDDPAVARLRNAGTAILGKTNLPELAAAIGTTNVIFPATNNPWREGYTPGGSTGGSAAAVAAGMATIGVGTDMGGSIRIPASCCGVVGLRPSVNRVPTDIVDAAGLSVTAPLGRTVADVRFAFGVMVAEEPPPREGRPRWRIGVADETDLDVHPACRDACRRAADALQKAGHQVRRVEWESLPVAEGYGVVRRASMASFPVDLEKFGPAIRGLVEQGRKVSALDFFSAYERATRLAMRAVNSPLLAECDFLLTPTLGLPPMRIEDVPPFLSEPYRAYVQFVLPVSFAKVPAVSVPAGLHEGLPVGVQLVGRFAQEWALLDLAQELEAMEGFGFQVPTETNR
jgi:Asp-tRNA(Asn)/Glu-tRNA(Gln) amidotransferase A subunit family amidase